MNYLTAIVALPLFLAIFCAETWMVFSSQGRQARRAQKSSGRIIIASCWAVSFLQMLSCWFWFFGFVFSTTNDVFSEAMESNEEMNCFGLVGAEVLLSLFQAVVSVMTMFQFLGMVSISSAVCNLRNNANAGKLSLLHRIALGVFTFVIAAYTVLAWFTARNRRCPQSDDQLMWFQHHFYPVYLLVDVGTSLGTHYFANKILDFVQVSIQPQHSLSQSSESPTTTTRRLIQLTKFYAFQCKLTIMGGLFALGMFVIQFSLSVEALSLIACVFCVLMYLTYAMRRVPMLAEYLRFDLRQRTYQTKSNSPNSNELESTQAFQKRMKSKSALTTQTSTPTQLELVRVDKGILTPQSGDHHSTCTKGH